MSHDFGLNKQTRLQLRPDITRRRDAVALQDALGRRVHFTRVHDDAAEVVAAQELHGVEAGLRLLQRGLHVSEVADFLAVNAVHHEEARFLVVDSINGQKISHLADVQPALQKPQAGFHTVEFLRGDNLRRIVVDAGEMDAATKRILERYRIPAASNVGTKL